MVSVRRGLSGAALLLLCVPCMWSQGSVQKGVGAAGEGQHWVSTWGASQQIPEPRNTLPAENLTDATMRQIIHLSIGGPRLRLRLSNAFGTEALHIESVHIAKPVNPASSKIIPGTDRALTFSGAQDVTIPAGAEHLSDPVDYPMGPLSDLAITFYEEKPPAQQTSHPGSRATTYYMHGNLVSAEDLPGAKTIEHWYMIAGLDVIAVQSADVVVTLGDSITDGHAATTNGNNRWPDVLADRMQANVKTRDLAMVNVGTGGNRLLAYGLGPPALARFDRDVLARGGVRYLIVLEGVNDLGGLHGPMTTAPAPSPGTEKVPDGSTTGWAAGSERPPAPPQFAPATPEQHQKLVKQIIASYQQIIERAHAAGIEVIGTTITPFGGSAYGRSAASEDDREKVNAWILALGHFDAVVDFAKTIADPVDPKKMATDYDSGDHLHPSVAGYHAMGSAIPLAIFERR